MMKADDEKVESSHNRCGGHHEFVMLKFFSSTNDKQGCVVNEAGNENLCSKSVIRALLSN